MKFYLYSLKDSLPIYDNENKIDHQIMDAKNVASFGFTLDDQFEIYCRTHEDMAVIDQYVKDTFITNFE